MSPTTDSQTTTPHTTTAQTHPTTDEAMTGDTRTPRLDARPDHAAGRGPTAWPVVATREVTARLTDRNFLISTGFTLALLIAIFVLQGLLAARTTTTQVAVTTPAAAQVVAASAATGIPGLGADDVVATTLPDAASARAAVQDGSVDAWLHEDAGTWVLTGKDTPGTQLTGALGAAVREHVMAANAAAAGTSMDRLAAGSTLRVDSLAGSAGDDGAMVRAITGAVFSTLFYLASLLFGMAIASSVVEEKQSRIVEILATAIPIRQLLIGKVLGNTLLALGQMVLFVGVGLVGLSFTDYSSVLPSLLGPSAWFLVFFLVGFVALACVWAVCGALASRNEDLQATTTPMSMLLVGLLFLGIMASGTTQVVASYVPIASAITMPGRLLAGTAAWWEPVVSLGVTVAFAGLMIVAAERLYRRSLLQTGGRLSLRQAWRVQE